MKKIVVFYLLILLGCENEAKYQASQLVGNWDAIEWNDLTNNERIDISVDFSFGEDGRYIGNYGDSSEEGKYWISGDNLHTIEDGKAEKKVKIKKLNQDTLIFGMNRGGTLEEIVLTRK